MNSIFRDQIAHKHIYEHSGVSLKSNTLLKIFYSHLHQITINVIKLNFPVKQKTEDKIYLNF